MNNADNNNMDKKTNECEHCRLEREKKSLEQHANSKNSCCSDTAAKAIDENKSCCSGHTEHNIKISADFASCCATDRKREKREEAACCCSEHSDPKSNASSGAACCGNTAPNSGSAKKRTVNKLVILAISLASLILGFFNWHKLNFMPFYYVNPAWIAVILCGVPIFRNAVRALSKKKITAAVLISTAILASIALEVISLTTGSHSNHSHSYVFAAGEVAFLMAVGGIIESATVKKTRSGIQRLIALIPKEAYVKTDNGLVRRALPDINIGDIVVAKAGEMIAVDGVIISGESAVDQSSVTGEYLPVDRAAGDNVYGGTFNRSGALEIKVTKLLKDMTVAKMAELVEEAEGKKAPISRVADRWASVIVPFAVLLAIIVGVIAGFAFRTTLNTALIRAVTVLVVFCPCALALATPTAIAAGIGNAAKNGVLIKSGQSVEALSRADTLCFDKTGTLTTGEIRFSNIETDEGINKEEFVVLMAGIEAYSEHPIAKAVIKYVSGKKLPVPVDVRTIEGVGIEAKIDNRLIGLYKYGYAIEKGHFNRRLADFAENELKQGKTVIAGVIDGKIAAAVSFSDTLRENAAQIIGEIEAKGYDIVMLTGDNKESAHYIADKTGIRKIRHSLLPEDKQREIAKLQAEGKKVCMLGDGVNDAPSLKTSDCGIAMGALGSDIALDTADMAILNSDISKVRDTLALSKKVLKTIKRNIIIAMGINFIAVTISAFGILTPVTGALVHNFTSILVVLSSALLLRQKKSS